MIRLQSQPQKPVTYPLLFFRPWAGLPGPTPIPLCLPHMLAEDALSRADQISHAGLDSHSLALCSNVDWSLPLLGASLTQTFQLEHLKQLSVIRGDPQRDEDPLYCTRRLCESGHEDPVILNLIVRGFIVSVDILPLSRFDQKRQAKSIPSLRVHTNPLVLSQITITSISTHRNWCSSLKLKLCKSTSGDTGYPFFLRCPMSSTGFRCMDASSTSIWFASDRFHHAVPIVR